MSRRLRYGVAVSLDGFIAGPKGEFDWIVMDPSIDFAAMYKEFDTRFRRVETFSPRNHVHTFRLIQLSDIDADFRAWLAEAYLVGDQQHLTSSNRAT